MLIKINKYINKKLEIASMDRYVGKKEILIAM
jgi:hypothetical protein